MPRRGSPVLTLLMVLVLLAAAGYLAYMRWGLPPFLPPPGAKAVAAAPDEGLSPRPAGRAARARSPVAEPPLGAALEPPQNLVQSWHWAIGRAFQVSSQWTERVRSAEAAMTEPAPGTDGGEAAPGQERPPAAEAAAIAAAAGEAREPELVVSGIMNSGGRGFVHVNGEIIEVGGSTKGGIRVDRIEGDVVVLTVNGRQRRVQVRGIREP